MADAISVQLADAIVATLNNETFSKSFTAMRAYAPIFALKDMGTLHVTVVPKKQTSDIATRGGTEETYEIFIAVQQRVAATSISEIDSLAAFTQEIRDHFEGEEAIDASPLNTRITAAPIDPIADWDYLMTKSQFLSLITLTVFVFR